MSSTAIKKLWEWIKAIVSKLFRRSEPEPAPGVLTELDKKLGQKIQERQEKKGKPVDTRQIGPNMPRYQFCRSCHRGAKRKRKTMGGAYYECNKHGEFFIRVPGL